MSRTRWEYIRITYIYSTEGFGASQTWDRQYWIFRPGAEPERLAADGADFNVLLNDLGADGWELITEHTRESVIIAGLYGWPNVGSPVSIMWTFKRPVEP